MKPGPREKPRELKIIEGVTDRQRIPEGIMEPDVKCPSKPHWLEGYGRAVWERLAPELYRCGVLKYTDRNALAVYCSLMSAFRDAVRADDTGRMIKLAPQIRGAGAEFGLTPSSRSGIHVGRPKADADDGKKASRLLG